MYPSRAVFIYGNLKVSLIPGDQPYPGFDFLVGEAVCSAKGTLYDLGNDAGYIPEGNSLVSGQIWIAESAYTIRELRSFFIPNGNCKEIPIRVKIKEDKEQLEIPVVTFGLERVPFGAKRIESGYWAVRSN